MGCLLENLGPHFSEIDWLPADVLASVLVDIWTWSAIRLISTHEI